MLLGTKPFGGAKGSDLDQNVQSMEPELDSPLLSPEARSLLARLLCKDPQQRLGGGGRGVGEIKAHAFFATTDWGLVECGHVRPAFVPSRADVNAESARDIGVANDAKWADTKLTPEFEAAAARFDYVSPNALQHEMVEILQVVDAGVDFEHFSPEAYRNTPRPQPPPKEDECCCTVQ